jgi:glycosyltransferase involved in cell wall biosynthesis
MRSVCLVIPCYNEARRLPADEILAFAAARPHVSICFVDDGSGDGTGPLLDSLQSRQPAQVLVHHLMANGGKAEAVRQGVLHAAAQRRFDLIGYWDADLSTPLLEADRMVAVFDADPDCVLTMGSRVKRMGAAIDRRTYRHVLGRVFSALAGGVLHLPVYDSQCGAKVFRGDLAGHLFREPFITRWLFDVELLARLRDQLGLAATLRAVTEVPLRAWREVSGSKLRAHHMAKAPLELLSIRARYPIRPTTGRGNR